MNLKKRNAIIILSISLFLIIFFFLTYFSQQIKMNDSNVTGNTAGNLNNSGLFCESNDVVYFSNSYDDGCLYSMTPDETNFKKLTAVKATSINADKHYLYYYLDSSHKGTRKGFAQRTYGIFRSQLNGRRTESLKRGNAITIQLCGNYLYYQNFDNADTKKTELYKIKIDKSEDIKVKDYNINPACCVDGVIYYNGTKDDHHLYSLNTTSDSIQLLWEGDIWNPIYIGDYVYFMDTSHNYRLCRYSMSQNVVEVLTDDRIDFYNIYDNVIYYQKSSKSEPALKRMYIDGSNVEIVAQGVYKNINITSKYVYFNEFTSDIPIYKTPTNGAVHVTTFDQALNAVLLENK